LSLTESSLFQLTIWANKLIVEQIFKNYRKQ